MTSADPDQRPQHPAAKIRKSVAILQFAAQGDTEALTALLHDVVTDPTSAGEVLAGLVQCAQRLAADGGIDIRAWADQVQAVLIEAEARGS